MTPSLLGFPDGSVGKESTRNAGDPGLIPGLGRSPGEGKGYPLQHSGLENSKDCIVHGVTKSQTRLSDFHFFPSLLGAPWAVQLALPAPPARATHSLCWNCVSRPDAGVSPCGQLHIQGLMTCSGVNLQTSPGCQGCSSQCGHEVAAQTGLRSGKPTVLDVDPGHGLSAVLDPRSVTAETSRLPQPSKVCFKTRKPSLLIAPMLYCELFTAGFPSDSLES